MYVICEECKGSGAVEIGPVCDMPASMCCGGCTKLYECENCNGSGYEEYEDEETEGE